MVKQKTQALLNSAVAKYVAQNSRSWEMSGRAKESLPGGNTRTGAYMPSFPAYIDRGEGVYLIDLDGHRLLDFVNNDTALILGHAHPAIVNALQARVAQGTGFSRSISNPVSPCSSLPSQYNLPSAHKARWKIG